MLWISILNYIKNCADQSVNNHYSYPILLNGTFCPAPLKLLLWPSALPALNYPPPAPPALKPYPPPPPKLLPAFEPPGLSFVDTAANLCTEFSPSDALITSK